MTNFNKNNIKPKTQMKSSSITENIPKKSEQKK